MKVRVFVPLLFSEKNIIYHENKQNFHNVLKPAD